LVTLIGIFKFKDYTNFLTKEVFVLKKENIKNLLVKKISLQNNIPLFFDNLMIEALITEIHNFDENLKSKFTNMFLKLNSIASDRFDSFNDRQESKCHYSNNKMTADFFTFCLSQGTHSPIKWKEFDIFKSSFDMAIYMQLISEIKPDYIVEYGSGFGESAVWLSDIASSLDLRTDIISYDIKKPKIKYKNVTFEEIDLTKQLPNFDSIKGKKLIIEDAHVNVSNVLLNTDKFLSKGDYLIVEDSGNKVRDINEFLLNAKNSYMVDKYYVDFFGRNSTSANDSIFAVF
tara:strand:- start:413 stop:1276 length:864 start_codon:yes stop_codon:yes gene_type:complete